MLVYTSEDCKTPYIKFASTYKQWICNVLLDNVRFTLTRIHKLFDLFNSVTDTNSFTSVAVLARFNYPVLTFDLFIIKISLLQKFVKS